jgi:hypothetical protein
MYPNVVKLGVLKWILLRVKVHFGLDFVTQHLLSLSFIPCHLLKTHFKRSEETRIEVANESSKNVYIYPRSPAQVLER